MMNIIDGIFSMMSSWIFLLNGMCSLRSCCLVFVSFFFIYKIFFIEEIIGIMIFRLS